jgi:hypothetical protein
VELYASANSPAPWMLHEALAGWDVSVIAQMGLQFDLATPLGQLIANLMPSLAKFEHERPVEGEGEERDRRCQSSWPGVRAEPRIPPELRPACSRGDAYGWGSYSQRRIARELNLSKTTSATRPATTCRAGSSPRWWPSGCSSLSSRRSTTGRSRRSPSSRFLQWRFARSKPPHFFGPGRFGPARTEHRGLRPWRFSW